MRLRGEVDDGIDVADELLDQCAVTDVALRKAEVRALRHRVEVADVACVGQLVEHHHAVLGVVGERLAYELTADEPGAAGDEQSHAVGRG